MLQPLCCDVMVMINLADLVAPLHVCATCLRYRVLMSLPSWGCNSLHIKWTVQADRVCIAY